MTNYRNEWIFNHCHLSITKNYFNYLWNSSCIFCTPNYSGTLLTSMHYAWIDAFFISIGREWRILYDVCIFVIIAHNVIWYLIVYWIYEQKKKMLRASSYSRKRITACTAERWNSIRFACILSDRMFTLVVGYTVIWCFYVPIEWILSEKKQNKNNNQPQAIDFKRFATKTKWQSFLFIDESCFLYTYLECSFVV